MRRLLWPVAVLLVVALGVGLWAFEPWRAFTSSSIDEAAPTSEEPAEETTGASAKPRPHTEPDGAEQTDQEQKTPASTKPAPKDEVLSRTDFERAEHETDGRAAILRLADGRRFVRLEDLATSDGPDLYVWLSGAPSGGDWGSYDDGRYVRLGSLKATAGNQNYEIPRGVDLRGLRSVVIWCDRFNVAFGTAPLDTA